MTRTFLSLELNTELQSHLADVMRQMALGLPSVRWVKVEGIHLTLAFLGDLDDDALQEAHQAALAAVQQVKPFSYRLSRVNIFGNPRHPRVIWIGIEEPTGRLIRLHRLLQRELARRNLPVEDRPFSPHLTLARVKAPLPPGEQQNLIALLEGKYNLPKSMSSYLVKSLAVMKSELFPSGALYTCLSEYPLHNTVSQEPEDGNEKKQDKDDL